MWMLHFGVFAPPNIHPPISSPKPTPHLLSSQFALHFPLYYPKCHSCCSWLGACRFWWDETIMNFKVLQSLPWRILNNIRNTFNPQPWRGPVNGMFFFLKLAAMEVHHFLLWFCFCLGSFPKKFQVISQFMLGKPPSPCIRYNNDSNSI